MNFGRNVGFEVLGLQGSEFQGLGFIRAHVREQGFTMLGIGVCFGLMGLNIS